MMKTWQKTAALWFVTLTLVGVALAGLWAMFVLPHSYFQECTVATATFSCDLDTLGIFVAYSIAYFFVIEFLLVFWDLVFRNESSKRERFATWIVRKFGRGNRVVFTIRVLFLSVCLVSFGVLAYFTYHITMDEGVLVRGYFNYLFLGVLLMFTIYGIVKLNQFRRYTELVSMGEEP